MQICAVSSFPPTLAGVADYGAHLADGLSKDPRVERVTVLADNARHAPRRERRGNVDVRRVWDIDSCRSILQLLRNIQALRPDVVWFNLGLSMFGTRPTAAVGGLLMPLLTRLFGYRTVVTLHELPALTNLGALGVRSRRQHLGVSHVPRVLLRTDLVVVTLGRYRRHLMERYGARNVWHIAHGAYGEPRWSAEPRQETVLVFGTFGPHKDPGVVAEAVERLRHRRPGLQLIVAGADHPRYPGFMSACRRGHHLNGSWIGYVPADRLAALFARATVVVVPPRASTGSSGVIYRAMSHGRAVLASDLPDYRALAQEENLDLAWFESASPDGLAGALQALLDDRTRRRDMVIHNLAAMQRLAPSRTVDAYLAGFAPRQAVITAAHAFPVGDTIGALETAEG